MPQQQIRKGSARMRLYIKAITPIYNDISTKNELNTLQLSHFDVDYEVYHNGLRHTGVKPFYVKDFTYSQLSESIANDVAHSIDMK